MSREAVERPGGRPVGQKPASMAALGLEREGGNMADNIKGHERKHLRLLISGKR